MPVCVSITSNRISFCLWPLSREIILKTLKQAFFCWIIDDNYISLSKKIRRVEITGVTGRRVDWRGSGEIKHCQFVLWTANACFIIIVYRFLCWYTSTVFMDKILLTATVTLTCSMSTQSTWSVYMFSSTYISTHLHMSSASTKLCNLSVFQTFLKIISITSSCTLSK